MNPGLALLITFLLLFFNAYFVAAEFAVTSSRRSRVEPLANDGNVRAKTVLWALEHVSLMLAVCQLGVTLCSVGLGVIAEPALAHLLEAPFIKIGIPSVGVHIVAVVLALMMVVALHVILGEMVPKNVTVTYPEKIATLLVPSLVVISHLVHPIIWLMNAVANFFVKLLGVEPKDEVSEAFTAEEVASIIEHSEAEGVLQDDLGLLSGVIEFTTRTARDLMVPANEILTVNEAVTPQELEIMVARTGYSRFGVANVGEEPKRYIHIKDVIYASPSQRDQVVPAWRMHNFAEVIANQEADHALVEMQKSGAHIAKVIDEDKQLLGFLFLEDIIEEIVGEVRDSMQRL